MAPKNRNWIIVFVFFAKIGHKEMIFLQDLVSTISKVLLF